MTFVWACIILARLLQTVCSFSPEPSNSCYGYRFLPFGGPTSGKRSSADLLKYAIWVGTAIYLELTIHVDCGSLEEMNVLTPGHLEGYRLFEKTKQFLRSGE